MSNGWKSKDTKKTRSFGDSRFAKKSGIKVTKKHAKKSKTKAAKKSKKR
jgi:hypothetical protein